MENSRYKYPVYFECLSLNTEEEKRIEKYFQIRRRSGGGPSGGLKKVDNKVYKILFEYENDQANVLQNREHMVKLDDRHVLLIMRGSQEPPLPSQSSPTPSRTVSPDLLHSAQGHSPPATTLPSSDVKHELPLDAYLLRFLRECPKARKDLEQELSSMGCSLQFDMEKKGEEKVSIQTDPGGNTITQWKTAVDAMFNRIKKLYPIHLVVDPHEASVLHSYIQSHLSGELMGDIRVYTDSGLAVVVGEHSQVQAALGHLSSTFECQGLGAGQKITTSHRLGEAKLRLLWEEIEQGLGGFAPGVKVTQGDSGRLVYEGSAGEVAKAIKWIIKKVGDVLERKISEVSPPLLAFLRKEFGGPGELAASLRVGGKVEAEVGDTELRLFALSTAKLEETETALKAEFKELNVDIPNCSAVPAELKTKLESKANKMNQRRQRIVVRFSSASTISLLGHAEGIRELNEEISNYIQNTCIQESTVPLPFSEIADYLPELLLLHGYDHSGVTFCPMASNSSPSVVLKGPPARVAPVKNRLDSVLHSLVLEKITIDHPGALHYFQSPTGREDLQKVGRSQKCLIQLQEPDHSADKTLAPNTVEGQGNITVARYHLNRGLQFVVCKGDLTKEHADALVNAANTFLKHGGGVAAALSKAGGPQVQKESSDLVKKQGKIPTGGVAVTTGGNLNCTALLHAVGPEKRKAGGKESHLLEKTIQAVLEKAESLKFHTIAMPCISSGTFGVPIEVCAKAIIAALRAFAESGTQGLSLNKVTLVDNREEVVSTVKDTCDKLLVGMDKGHGSPRDDGLHGDTGAAFSSTVTTADTAVDCLQVEVIQGNIETQKLQAIVCPMLGHEPISTSVGQTLARCVGSRLAAVFHAKAGGATLPGESVPVEGLSGLSCHVVFFIHLICWGKNSEVLAVQKLREAIQSTLHDCNSRGLSSLAIPVLGAGAPFNFPHNVAAKILLEEIKKFEQKQRRHPFLVRIVVHPDDRESSKALLTAQRESHLKGFNNNADPDQATFYRLLSSSDGEVTIALGRVKLQLVCGNIIYENTDIIVNSTNFSGSQSGVSKAILTAAGPIVAQQFAKAGIPSDLMCTTGPGLLNCKEIFHASFKNQEQRIRTTCGKILDHCETRGYQSVSFPAINTGAAGMQVETAAKAMLDGMASAVRDLNPQTLSFIRIIILTRPVFLAFRSDVESRLGQTAPDPTWREKLSRVFTKTQQGGQNNSQGPHPSPPATPGHTSPGGPPPAVLRVVASKPRAVATSVKRDLENILREQLKEQKAIGGQELSGSEATELGAVQAETRPLRGGLEATGVERGTSDDGAGAGARSGTGHPSGPAGDVLRGLKEDIRSDGELEDGALNTVPSGGAMEIEVGMLTHTVQDHKGVWHELPSYPNELLEQAWQDRHASIKLKPRGKKMTIDLGKLEARDCQTGLVYRVRREESGGLTSPEVERHSEGGEGVSAAAEGLYAAARDPLQTELPDVVQGDQERGEGASPKAEKLITQEEGVFSTERRIVLLGKTGAGKSSIGNTIFAEKVFTASSRPNSETSVCHAESRLVHGRKITQIDTPGLFDTNLSDEKLKPEILRCLTECSPGPHAFLIVLKVEKFTRHEQEVIEKICEYFSPEALRYAIIIFTHGNNLEEMNIRDFVNCNPRLKALVANCGGRCHVFDNRDWNDQVKPDKCKSNQLQVAELLKTIDTMVEENGGMYFTNEALEAVEKQIQQKVEEMKKGQLANQSAEQIRTRAKKEVHNRLVISLVGITVGALLGALLSGFDVTTMGLLPKIRDVIRTGEGVVNNLPVKGPVARTPLSDMLRQFQTAIIAIVMVAGGAAGGVLGCKAAETANTPREAANLAYRGVMAAREDVLKRGPAAIKDVQGTFQRSKAINSIYK